MLNIAKLQLFYRLSEQANSAKERAADFYGKEAKRMGLDWSNYTYHHGDITSVDYDGIVVSWDEYHRNCRTDGGRFTMPWDALADDTYREYVTDLVGEQVAKQNAQKTAASDRELMRKREQLAKLKAELGEA